MLLIYDDHVIQQLPAGAANPALRRSVLPWAPECRSFRRDVERGDRLRYLVRKDRVGLEYQVARGRIIRECLAELLIYPLSRRAVVTSKWMILRRS